MTPTTPTAAPGVSDLIPRSVLTLTIHRLRCVANGNAKPELADVAADELQAAILASAAVGQAEPMNLALCEASHLVLRVGRPYMFSAVGDCKECAALAASAEEAYGKAEGSPDVQHVCRAPPPPVGELQGVTDEEVDAAMEGLHFTATGIPRREDMRFALEAFAASRLVKGVVTASPESNAIDSARQLLEEAPCGCPHKMRYEDGLHLSGCYLFELSVALAPPPEGGIGEPS